MDNKKIAAELVDNFAWPTRLRDRTKQADFADNVKQLLAGAGQQAATYLKDPKNVVARNALIGAGVGGAAGLASSSGGRRISDTLRGAMLGGTLGGAGTLAYQGARGAKQHLTSDAVPADLKEHLKEPEEGWMSSIGSWRPGTLGTAGFLGGKEILARHDAQSRTRTLGDRINPGYFPRAFTREKNQFQNLDLNKAQQNRVLDQFQTMLNREQRPDSFLSKITGKAEKKSLLPGYGAFSGLIRDYPDEVTELLQEAVRETKTPTMSPLEASSDTAKAQKKPNPLVTPLSKRKPGDPLSKLVAEAEETVNKHPTVKAKVAQRESRFEKLRTLLADQISDEKEKAAFGKLTPKGISATGRARPQAFKHRLPGTLGTLGALGIGYAAEPAIWNAAASAADLLGTNHQLSPEEIQRRADLYLAAQGQ